MSLMGSPTSSTNAHQFIALSTQSGTIAGKVRRSQYQSCVLSVKAKFTKLTEAA